MGDFDVVSVSEEEHRAIQSERERNLAKYSVKNPCWMLCCFKESGHSDAHGHPRIQ